MRPVLIFGLIFFLSACGQKDILLKNSWLIVDGTYKEKPIKFHSTDFVVLTDQNGNVLNSLHFGKDGEIILPGINTGNIAALWTIENGQIKFTLDSMRYYLYAPRDLDLSALVESDSAPAGNDREEEGTETEMVNPLDTKELKTAMEIYGQSFDYYISADTLVMTGEKGVIRAVRDRTIDDLFKNVTGR